MPAFESGDYRAVAGLMLESAELPAPVGADFAIRPDNSAHRAEYVQPNSRIPWLHIAKEVASEAQRRGFQRVGVLGTGFTMDGPVYADALGAVEIEAVRPEPETSRRSIESSSPNWSEVSSRPSLGAWRAWSIACAGGPQRSPSRYRNPDAHVRRHLALPTLDSTLILALAALRESQTSDMDA
jgi:aspartate racemase